ncbi:DUF1661 domain-containing protein [Porphyromonas gulae]|uniref:DUF1661 domain-containing protein n=1 Tax=Porphyromonas gulae TaxID=111105 RepID=UPI0034E95417
MLKNWRAKNFVPARNFFHSRAKTEKMSRHVFRHHTFLFSQPVHALCTKEDEKGGDSFEF